MASMHPSQVQVDPWVPAEGSESGTRLERAGQMDCFIVEQALSSLHSLSLALFISLFPWRCHSFL